MCPETREQFSAPSNLSAHSPDNKLWKRPPALYISSIVCRKEIPILHKGSFWWLSGIQRGWHLEDFKHVRPQVCWAGEKADLDVTDPEGVQLLTEDAQGSIS